MLWVMVCSEAWRCCGLWFAVRPGAGNHVLIGHGVVVQPHARDVTSQFFCCVDRPGKTISAYVTIYIKTMDEQKHDLFFQTFGPVLFTLVLQLSLFVMLIEINICGWF